MKKVFINGYGSIGSRITSFLKDDPEITVMGIGKYSPDEKVNVAISSGLNVYVPERKLSTFSDYKISGSIESALDECDLVIDAAPGGHGYKNKKNLYEPKNIPAIYQGGESTIGDESVSDLLFNSRANYDLALGKQHVMQGSCNVTGIGRILERTQLVETPQFLNILFDGMSFIGNRPLPEDNIKFLREYANWEARFESPSGITGISQVVGKIYLNPVSRLKIESMYSEVYNSPSGNILKCDAFILYYTIKFILTGIPLKFETAVKILTFANGGISLNGSI